LLSPARVMHQDVVWLDMVPSPHPLFVATFIIS
jgi:hypothetical protein